jgi:hypothetical protein
MPETKIEKATPLADTSKGEVSPAADQTNRTDQLAAQLAAAPLKTPPSENVSRENPPGGEHYTPTVSSDGDFVDPDSLVLPAPVAAFPTKTCINCENQGRHNVPLDENGFCKKCGFKLNRISNMALEPDRKPLPNAPATAEQVQQLTSKGN